MDDKEWEKFFELVDKIVQQKGLTVEEKITQLRRQSNKYGSGPNLAELTSYVGEE